MLKLTNIKCCKCGESYDLAANLYASADSNTPVLNCPHCGFQHTTMFLPVPESVQAKELVHLDEIDLGTTYYVNLGASRIADASRVDQSGSDDADVADWSMAEDFILATRIYTSKGPINRTYALFWRDVTADGTFVNVIATGEINHTADTVLVDTASLPLANARCDAQSGYTWQDGRENEGNFSVLKEVLDEYYTELQWALNPSDAVAGHEYELELYDVTEGTSIGTCLSSITMAAGAQTYEESVTFSATAGISPSSSMILDEALTLAVSSTISPAGGMVYDESITLSTAAGVTPGSNNQIEVSTSLDVTAGLLQEAVGVFLVSVDLDVSAGVSFDASLIIAAALTLVASAGMSQDGTIAGGGVYDESVTLAASAGISSAANSIIEALTTLTAAAGESADANLHAEAGITLGAISGILISAQADLQGSIDLSVTAGQTQTASMMANASIVLSAIAGMLQSGFVGEAVVIAHQVVMHLTGRKHRMDLTSSKKSLKLTGRKLNSEN